MRLVPLWLCGAVMVCLACAVPVGADDKKPADKPAPETTATKAPPPATDAEVALFGLDARMYLRHSKDWLAALSFKARARAKLTPQRVQDLGVAIQRDLGACSQALDSLKVEYSLYTDIADRISRIRDRLDKVQEIPAQIQKASQAEPFDLAPLANSSADAWHILDAADVELSGLLRTLKIDGLPPPRRPQGEKSKDPAHAPLAESTTVLGQGFRPRTATSLHRAALDHARALSDYSQASRPVADETVLQHLSEIDRQLTALKAEYGKLDEMYRKQQQVETHVQVVEAQQTKVQGQIEKLKGLIATRKLNATELKEVSDVIYRSLSGSMGQFYQILDKAGVSHETHHDDALYSP
ncbi:MAG: hypothetical protein JSS02_06930 [Planctomycetes bacterium]|nr:hypothetical protein [Planctomycetota bacterium]